MNRFLQFSKILVVYMGILFCPATRLMAQDIRVNSFVATNSPDASINPEKDTAGEYGALIKVEINSDCTFNGYYILGNRPKRQDDNCYWVYMTASQQRADSLKVSSQGQSLWVRFADYGIKLEPGRTYELRMHVTATNNVEPVSPNDFGSLPKDSVTMIAEVATPATPTRQETIPQSIDAAIPSTSEIREPDTLPQPKEQSPRRFFKPTTGYVQAGFMVGGLMAPTASLGMYIHNVNVEGFFAYGLNSETVYSLSPSGYSPTEGVLNPLVLGGKLGYGIVVARRLRITPQVGCQIVTASAKDIVSISPCCWNLGARVECGIGPAFSIFASPQYMMAVNKGEAFAKLSEMSSKASHWATGFDVTFGLSINF